MTMDKGSSGLTMTSKRRAKGGVEGCSITIDSLSELLLDLYRCSRELPLADFQRQALERLQLVLPFDKAWWGIGTADRELHGSFAFHLPTSYAAAWERIKRQDLLADLAQSSIGRTVAVDFAGPVVVAEYRTFGAQFGIRHALTTFELNTELNLRMFLSIYRAPEQPAFSGGERQLKELLMPHLWAAWTANWIGQLQRLRANASSSRAALAVADDRGILLAAEPRFLDLTRAEWPGWQGPELPSGVHTGIAASTGYVGTNIELKSASVQGLHLVELRLRSRLDVLTPRERAVAEAFGVGRSYREIAAALGRSPTTIRHHLRVVYEKLGISDKVELAHLVNANVDGTADRVITDGVSGDEELEVPGKARVARRVR
jgi:DNA-binding CsgD family transcriptional regulator